METEHLERVVARQSALVYIPLALGAAVVFALLAIYLGGYPPVAVIGGAVWVALLSLIVLMPLVTSRVKKRRS